MGVIQDMEKKKFVDGDSQEPSVRVNLNNLGGFNPNVLAKFVEATYTNSDMTVTYNYYESSSKVTLYDTIVTEYSTAQSTEFTSASWE